MIRTPAHKQTDPNKAPGTCNFDRYPYMKHSTAKTPEIEQYLHQYIARKQAETPKKLTFDDWYMMEFLQLVEDAERSKVWCLAALKRCWEAAQENMP